MFDLHTHLFPGVDDGAPDLDESAAMARMSLAGGITGMVATVHSAEALQFGLTSAVMADQVRHLRRQLAERGVAIDVFPGSEIFAEPDCVQLVQSGRLSTINESRYVLVEPPMNHVPDYFDGVLQAFQRAGYFPIVAHPERNLAILADPSVLPIWAGRGMVLQLTAGSLIGEFGKRVQRLARMGVENRWFHVVASDAHGSTRRPPRMAEARAEMLRLVGEQAATQACDVLPSAILQDEVINVPAPRYEHKRTGIWLNRFRPGRG